MKKYFNQFMYSGLLILAMMFTSCQEEFEPLNNGDEQEALKASSTTAQLMKRTSDNDGSFDNIVDGASCFAVNFPYTVEIKGIQITIDSLEDLHIIERIFDEFDDDLDVLEIIFPVTITLADFTEIVINGTEDLRRLAEECREGGDDDDIECIDFVYPISLFTFNPNFEETGSVTINSDRELRRFFAGLDDDDLISVDFPVTLELYDGSKITVTTNAELANAIESAKEACDEDDDNDYNDDDFTKERLDAYLVECPWYVKEITRNDMDQIAQYQDYVFNFKEDGTVSVKDRLGNVLNGEWETEIDDHGALLEMDFDVLVDFNLAWRVYEIDDHKIKLFNGEANRIIMKQICDDDNGDDTDPNTLREILKECEWVIKKVKNQGEEIDRLLGFEFKFMADGVITLSNGITTSEGTWEIKFNMESKLVMSITMGDEPGVSFEWPLRDLKNDRLKFEVEEIDYELILQRVCDDNAGDGDVAEIRNFMMGGEWIVALYTDNEVNETTTFNGYSLNFMADHQISLLEGTEAFGNGLWRVIRNSDQQLKVYLNFGVNMPFDELTDDWELVSATADRIELKDVSDDGSKDVVVFEKK